jgi:hypothetical protein
MRGSYMHSIFPIYMILLLLHVPSLTGSLYYYGQGHFLVHSDHPSSLGKPQASPRGSRPRHIHRAQRRIAFLLARRYTIHNVQGQLLIS